MRITLLISVVGKIKRGGESTTIGLVSFLSKYAEIDVLAGGSFPFSSVVNLGFPELSSYKTFYERLPQIIKYRILRRLHLDPLSVRNFLFCKRSLTYLSKNLPDIIIYRSIGPWGGKYGRYFRRRYNVPFITIEGGWKKGERETARFNPNLHITVNLDVADYLHQQLPDVNVVYIPNGISVANFQPNGQKASIHLPRPLILGCGMLGDVKRFHLSIMAVHRLKVGSLLLLGKGEQEKRLRRLGNNLLPGRFDIKAVPYREMATYYRAADVLTVPSSAESFGMVYLEAMACDTPVVATRDRNREKIIGEGGILIDPENIDSYAAALNHCINTDSVFRPRKQAEKYDWGIIGPNYLNLIEKVISDGNRPNNSFPIYRRMGD
jgi:glycosyltransferase involved in cell wall biosynthesis